MEAGEYSLCEPYPFVVVRHGDVDDDGCRPAVAVPQHAPVEQLSQLGHNLRALPDGSAGVKQTGLIFGIDFSESNTWNGFRCGLP